MIDLDGVGLSIDDLDLDFDADDLPTLPLDRPRHQPKGWWTTTEAEAHFLDLPDFESGAQCARHMIERMARAALANIPGATADDPALPHAGKMVSLNNLLATVGTIELGVDLSDLTS